MARAGVVGFIVQRATHVRNVLSYKSITRVTNFNGVLDMDGERE